VDPEEAPMLADTPDKVVALPDPDDEPVLSPRGRLILIICFTLAVLLMIAAMIVVLGALAYKTPPVGGG